MTQATKTTVPKNRKTITVKIPSSTIATQTQQAKKQTQANNSQKDLIARIQKQYSTQQITNATQTTNNTQANLQLRIQHQVQKTTNSKPSKKQPKTQDQKIHLPLQISLTKQKTTAKTIPTQQLKQLPQPRTTNHGPNNT